MGSNTNTLICYLTYWLVQALSFRLAFVIGILFIVFLIRYFTKNRDLSDILEKSE